MTRGGKVLTGTMLLVLAVVFLVGTAGADKPSPKPIEFTMAYSGAAEYTSHRHFDCLDESESDVGKWLVLYDFKVPHDGPPDFVGDEGKTFPEEVGAGYKIFGSGCGEPVTCGGDLAANPAPDVDLRPLLAGKPKKKAIDFTVDAPSDWRASGISGSNACPEDGERAFYPAYVEEQLPSMLQAEFKLPVGDLRDLPPGGKMTIAIKSRPEQLPPNDCTKGGASCTQELSPWKGKVVIHRSK